MNERKKQRVLIIAEAGVNHNGSIQRAKQMIESAKKCGADIVKFQTANVNSLVSQYAQMANYQKKNIGKEESQKEMLDKLILPFESFLELKSHCDTVGIQFLSTPFDIESIQFLNELVPFWKIPSGEITNYPYLVEIGKTGKQVILSTGMSEMEEIAAAITLLKENGTKEITLLHCNTQYPTPYADVNLRAMKTLKDTFHLPTGYSDHTEGIEIPIAAVSMGAEVIEKHFTLDRSLPGPDHKASLEPDELQAMVKAIRNVEIAMGDGVKTVSRSEKENLNIARKSIIAAVNICWGELFTEKNLTTKRPGNGISPMRWNEVIGNRAKRDFLEDELIEL